MNKTAPTGVIGCILNAAKMPKRKFWFKSLGAEHANLECLEDNDVGNQLYRSEGFTEVARSIRWFVRIL